MKTIPLILLITLFSCNPEYNKPYKNHPKYLISYGYGNQVRYDYTDSITYDTNNCITYTETNSNIVTICGSYIIEKLDR